MHEEDKYSNHEMMSKTFDNERDPSWLDFNNRVLQLAASEIMPITERLKFASIAESNLMEFISVRYARLKRRIDNPDSPDSAVYKHLSYPDFSRMYEAITREIKYQMTALSILFHRTLIKFPTIDKKVYKTVSYQTQELTNYYMSNIKPYVKTFDIGDKGRTIPLLPKTVYLCIKWLDENGISNTSIIQIPDSKRVLYDGQVSYDNIAQYKLLDDIIVDDFVKTRNQVSSKPISLVSVDEFIIIRDNDVRPNFDHYHDMMSTMEDVLKRRRNSDIVKFICTNEVGCGDVIDRLGISHDDVIVIACSKHGHNHHKNYSVGLGISYNMIDGIKETIHMYGLDDPESKNAYKYVYPKDLSIPSKYSREILSSDKTIFDIINGGDILLHHPYDTFDVVVKFFKDAANDRNVISIRQTLYRVSKNSPIVNALCKAAKKGKDVTVFVELKARFDERHNIQVTKKLQKAGCTVCFGTPTIKTHSKITEVVRREDGKDVTYLHLGTGNYNDVTAQIYEDYSLLTRNKSFAKDAKKFLSFVNMNNGVLTIDKPKLSTNYKKFLVSPFNTKTEIINMIRKTAAYKDNKAEIVIKINALTDNDVIQELIGAGYAGVKIRLIVRGACGISPSMGPNICISSYVGRFLEHSRVYYFKMGKKEVMYCGSADLLPRNLERRNEILFPLTGKNMRRVLKEILNPPPYQIEFNCMQGYDEPNSDWWQPSSVSEFEFMKYLRRK